MALFHIHVHLSSGIVKIGSCMHGSHLTKTKSKCTLAGRA